MAGRSKLSSIYVSDTNNDRTQKFISEGVFVTKWGTGGTGDGEFGSPKDVSVDPNGIVFVADRNNNRVQKFSVAQ